MKKRESIVNAAFILMAGTVVSKVLGFARELLVAYKYGAGSVSDAFLLTNSIPSIIFVSVGTAVQINYIPFYHSLKKKEEQDKFTSNLVNIVLVILLAGCIIVNIFPRAVLKIFAAGLTSETEQYAVVMLRIVMFSIIPIILTYIFQAYEQVNGRFYTTALVGIVTNVVIIVTTLVSTEKVYYVLSIGMVLAHATALLIAFFGAKSSGYHYTKIFEPFNEQMKTLLIFTLPLVAENIAYSMNLVADRNLASFLDSGTISGLSYAGTLGNVASTMIAGAIITATFPVFSKLMVDSKYDKFNKEFSKYSNVISFFLCPISIAIIFHARDIVVFIFEHGAFESVASRIVWESMTCYAVGVVPAGLQTYLTRGYYAMQDTKTPVKIKVFSFICNIVLNLATVSRWKHMGIAMSTSISYINAYMLLAYYLRKKHKIKSVKDINKGVVMGSALSIASGLVSFFMFNYWIEIDILFVKIFWEMAVFAVIYLSISAIINRKILLAALKIKASN